MVRALLLGIPIMLACGGTRGPDPIELTPETIEEAARVLSEAAERNPDFEPFVDVVLSAMQGRALGSLACPNSPGSVGELVTLYRLARRELGDSDS